MSNKRILAVFLMIVETLIYVGLLSIIGVKDVTHFIILYLMFQLLFKHYTISNILIYQELEILVKSHCSIYLVQILFSNFIPLDILLLGVINFLMIFINLLIGRMIRRAFREQLADRIMIIGVGHHAHDFIRVAKSNRFALLNPKVCLDANNCPGFESVKQEYIVREKFTEKEIPIEPYTKLDEVIEKYNINSVMIAIPDATRDEMAKIMRDLFDKVSIVKFMPRVNGMFLYDSKITDLDGLVVASSSNERRNIFGKIVKRMMDICAGIAGCIILIPLTVVIKILTVKSGDKESIFFTQDRIGKNGKIIKIYKYRSMIPNAEAVLEKLIAENEDIRKEYLENKKLENDPRITKVGAFIRKTSLDEFPQFINVLKGDMSLIGPRPYLPREKEDMDIYYNSIIKCKPGITGMWQANGRSDVAFTKRIRLDDYYYRNWNIWLDVIILYKTVKSVIYGEGAM